MKKILSSYFIDENVKALKSVNDVEYRTVVHTTEEKLYVELDPLKIINYSCLYDGSSYEGRKEAVRHLLAYSSKFPIMINSRKGIFAFPTSSPRNPECVWLIHHQVAWIEDISKKARANEEYLSIVHFTDRTSLPLKATANVLNHQFARTSYCKTLFSMQSIQ